MVISSKLKKENSRGDFLGARYANNEHEAEKKIFHGAYFLLSDESFFAIADFIYFALTKEEKKCWARISWNGRALTFWHFWISAELDDVVSSFVYNYTV